MVSRHSSGKSLDLVTLSQALLDSGQMASIGGPAAVTEIYTYTSASAHFATHLALVKSKSLLRRIIHTSTEALTAAYDPDSDPMELLESMEAKTLSMRSERDMTDSSVSMKQLMGECMDHYDACRENKGFGIPTGFHDLDFRTGGLHPGDLIVTAARPSVGKTALAMAMMEHQTVHNNIPALFFSTEMSRLSVGHRAISAMSRINLGKLVQGDNISKEIISNVRRAIKSLKPSPLYIIDTPSMTAAAIKARARREVKRHGIKVIYIDYLQLLRGVDRSERDSPNIRISNALKILKIMARELNVPVVILAQLGRPAEEKLCHELNNAMIKDCGEVEQDADVIFMIGKLEQEKAQETDDSVKRGINVTKQRQGPTGCIPPVLFIKTSAKFTNL
jgi:replicative DNA helicase